MQDLLSLSYADCHGGHKGALQSRARSLPRKSMKFQFLVLLTASFLALYGSGGLSTTGALAEPPVQPACELDGKKATCTCKQGGSPQKLDVTI
ncbi:hypothetical protein BESB_050160 [Besnoitia besnoiti]|uniref:Uncharacterized protein n=1 Tax=Besnoitia besnoiti TaxID=94643 RepID=A0A2A9MI00_BESBE|nr:hypothetical protein BESB_050160 [Besnoitia besnoiti]PFH36824.1 hypothetical protein BESB_050160 [Besnoitia besnoiti]